MAYGLQVFNASGQLWLEITDRLTQYLGYYSYSLVGTAMTINVTIPGLDPATWLVYGNSSGHQVTPYAGYANVTRIGNSGTTEGGILTVFRS